MMRDRVEYDQNSKKDDGGMLSEAGSDTYSNDRDKRNAAIFANITFDSEGNPLQKQ